MSNKTAAVLSAVLTAILLGIAAVFFEMVALNGFNSDRVAVISMGSSLVCQSVGGILIVLLAFRLTNHFITKFNWNKFLALVASMLAGVLLGAVVSFIAMMIAIFIAGGMS